MKEAAQEHYRANASQLLRVTFAVVIDDRSEKIRAFWPVKRPTGRTDYTPTEEVAMDPVTEAVMLRQMQVEWKRFRNRYSRHSAFCALIKQDWPENLPPLDGDGTDG
jgi:hypothetical protein